MTDELLSANDLGLIFNIRHSEEELLKVFSDGKLRGTTHTYLGQESIAVAVGSFLNDEDIVVSNHRCHGHYLAYGGDLEKLFLEIKGSAEGVCKGVGGSQHLCYKNFYTNGIQGGMVPVTIGMALAEKINKENSIAVIFIGDGTLGEGVVYESLNIASLLSTPVLFVVENNRYAQSTPISKNMSGKIIDRFKSFGIESDEIETNDVVELYDVFRTAFNYVRDKGNPFCQIINTYRLGPHSKGDDYRNKDEVARWKEKDPIILAKKYFNEDDYFKIESDSINLVKAVSDKVFSNSDNLSVDYVVKNDSTLIPKNKSLVDEVGLFINENNKLSFVKHLNSVLTSIISSNRKCILIGEDICDPYGGAFKVTKGISETYPEQVIGMPISEAAIVGVANGLAIRGFTPIVEIMFGDFTTLIVDQVVNHATKFNRMYAEKVRCPVIIRTPMGGYRGFGPTHSQSLEKLFLGVPGLVVIAANTFSNQAFVWERMLNIQSPIMYIENKTMYGQTVKTICDDLIDGFTTEITTNYFPNINLQLVGFSAKTDVVCFVYGAMAELAMSVAKEIFIHEEIVVKVVVVTQLSPYPINDICESAADCRNIVILEEGTTRNGWGAELSAILNENVNEKIKISRLGSENTIIPSSENGELNILPNDKKLYDLILENLNEL